MRTGNPAADALWSLVEGFSGRRNESVGRMTVAVRVTLALHRPIQLTQDAGVGDRWVCRSCEATAYQGRDPYPQWPCTTVRHIAGVLGFDLAAGAEATEATE